MTTPAPKSVDDLSAPLQPTPNGEQSAAAAWTAEIVQADHALAIRFSVDALHRRLQLMGRRPRYTGPANRGGAFVGEGGALVIHGAWAPEHLPLLVAWIAKTFGMEDPQ